MATACLLGVPAERIVYGDEVDRVFWSLVVQRALQADGVRRDNQAMANAQKIGDLLKRMFRRRG